MKNYDTQEMGMPDNEIIRTLLNRKSIRHFRKTTPTEDVVETIVRSGQQAPFASQLCSLLLSRKCEENPFHAPLFFIVCIDAFKWERIMEKRGWKMVGDDLLLILLGLQDAALMAENMVIAGESLGLGSCFLGGVPFESKAIIEKYDLPPRVFPMVGLAMGYPDGDHPPRPRYPLDFVLFEDRYPHLDDALIEKSMKIMDEGYLAQDYYRKLKAKIPLKDGREETFDYDTYSWTEHISRKWGQHLFPKTLWRQFERCGFDICAGKEEGEKA